MLQRQGIPQVIQPSHVNLRYPLSHVCLLSRFVQYNGGLSEEQLLWLENELVEASRAGQRVVCFGHVPIHPVEPSSLTLVWNYEDVRVLLDMGLLR